VILRGAFQFFSDLNNSINKVRAIKKPTCDEEDVIVRFNFHRVSSYQNTESLGAENVSLLFSNIFDAFLILGQIYHQ
jgi:hypothetical protein